MKVSTLVLGSCRTRPVEEGAVLPGNVPQPHGLCGQLVQCHPLFLPLCLVLEQQGGQKDPRLQDHVLLLGPHQPVGRVIHKAVDVLARPPWDVSANGELTFMIFKFLIPIYCQFSRVKMYFFHSNMYKTEIMQA